MRVNNAALIIRPSPNSLPFITASKFSWARPAAPPEAWSQVPHRTHTARRGAARDPLPAHGLVIVTYRQRHHWREEPEGGGRGGTRPGGFQTAARSSRASPYF